MEIQIGLIGHKKQLPRGDLMNQYEKDNDYFHSIHLVGEKKMKLLKEAQENEYKTWKSKIVVDTTDFKVGRLFVTDKITSQVDKLTDILHDEAKRKPLKFIRQMKSSTKGLDWSYQTTPLSILNREPYLGNIELLSLRAVDKKEFVTASHNQTDVHGDPKDFIRFIASDATAPRVTKFISSRAIPAQDKSSKECTGPKWEGLT